MASDERTFHIILDALSLKNLPRTGWGLRGAPRESVADHSFGVGVIALALARMEGLSRQDESELLRRALLHDLHEVRIGDLTPDQKKAIRPDEKGAETELLEGSHLEEELASLHSDRDVLGALSSNPGQVALLCNDADKLDMLFRAIEYANAGNQKMGEFLSSAMLQIKSSSGKKLAKLALARLRK
ncbi:HD domain protein [uncultured archaeon]|nr:HD domain protein [uncultured archaeon]